MHKQNTWKKSRKTPRHGMARGLKSIREIEDVSTQSHLRAVAAYDTRTPRKGPVRVWQMSNQNRYGFVIWQLAQSRGMEREQSIDLLHNLPSEPIGETLWPCCVTITTMSPNKTYIHAHIHTEQCNYYYSYDNYPVYENRQHLASGSSLTTMTNTMAATTTATEARMKDMMTMRPTTTMKKMTRIRVYRCGAAALL